MDTFALDLNRHPYSLRADPNPLLFWRFGVLAVNSLSLVRDAEGWADTRRDS